MFDCDGCLNGPLSGSGFPAQPIERRREWHCGWMDADDWEPLNLPLGDVTGRLILMDEHGEERPAGAIVCPGWVVRQPAVMEGMHAFQAAERGVLRDYYPRLENAVLEAADVAKAAFNIYEVEQIRKQ